MKNIGSEENFIATRIKEKSAAKEFYENEYDENPDTDLTKEEYVEREMLLGERDELENINMRGEVKLEASKEEIVGWKEKWRQDRIDDVTGLEIRKVLFEKMRKKINNLFEIRDSEKENKTEDELKNEKEEIFNKIIGRDVEELKKENFSVMMADVSFLSLVNEAGHEAGDKLLSEICTEVKKRVYDSYRHGGDEITGLFDVTDKEVDEKIKELKASVEKLNIEKVKEYKLTPNLDIGKAHISEAVQIFKEISGGGEQCEKKLKQNPVKELENIMVAIADKRSFIDKGKKRIALLADKFSEDKKAYSDMIGFLRKGGYNIKNEEVKDLNKFVEQGNKKKIGKWIVKFITEKEKNGIEKLSKSENRFNYIKAKEIFEFVKKDGLR